MSNQKYITQPALINLNPNEYSQEFHYYSFSFKSERCVGSCSTQNDLSNKVCVPNRKDDLNLSVFNMITEITESKTLTKRISYKHNCKFNGRNVIQTNCGITVNVDVSVKNIIYEKNIIFGILLQVAVKMENM